MIALSRELGRLLEQVGDPVAPLVGFVGDVPVVLEIDHERGVILPG